MSASRLDLDEIRQGDDYVYELEFVDPDGTAFDLTDRTYRSQLRRDVTDGEPAATFDIDIDPPDEGRLLLRLDREITTLLPRGLYEWALEETVDDGDRTTLFAGRVPVVKDSTR